ncbi:dimethylargininase [Asanoa siamensis]|uniref:N(G),N(G)-dimethylarginine dimethylaminohydrolase n=1 Tax=Asanoa siamensis TaxID=926357 RepID=A0ABQ4CHQ6_9ACTN|nr:dimethylargininase [Asanoa siamensis]GIF70812.1 N(G),N(G)-dimethylarginine dimethylaminohydrolase [Asanoa siamensis]
MITGTALVRAPSPRLADGIVTHIERSPIDVGLARRQRDAYRAALADAGWSVVDVAPADDCPDSVFVEDTLVVCGGLAVVTRPGAPERRPEVQGARAAAEALLLDVVEIQAPGTLDGGDVLQVGDHVYVGVGGRTNEAGFAQLRDHLATRGRTTTPVTLHGVLHLKSAVTALPDGTLVALPGLVDIRALPPLLPVEEEAGCHVVPLGDERVLIAASAPRTADLIHRLGFAPVVVDISEYEKLEGCVTCLNVLIPPIG